MKTFLIIIFLPFIALAQSEFIKKGHFGVGANFGFVTNAVMNGSGGSFGMSIGGIGEFGAEYINAEITNESSEYSSSSTLLYIAYNVKRKNNKSNFKLLLGFMISKLSNRFENSGIAVGFSFTIRAIETEKIMLLPALSMVYGFLEVEERSYYGNYFPERDSYILNTRSISLEVNLKVKLSENMSFIIGPSIAKNLNNTENSIAYSILGGLLLDLEM
ncbi:MAG: hypothetical protein HND52_04800 [Ignavibacteriae bacterium]|nr:hypothetical protein [Ignavibacteriota bacterium]NOG97278.1 hypothetical protein [Ignavibacteriota bacterium]